MQESLLHKQKNKKKNWIVESTIVFPSLPGPLHNFFPVVFGEQDFFLWKFLNCFKGKHDRPFLLNTMCDWRFQYRILKVWSQATFYAMLTLQNARGPRYQCRVRKFVSLWSALKQPIKVGNFGVAFVSPACENESSCETPYMKIVPLVGSFSCK